MSALALRFAGYAGLFNIADGARDTIRKGAFARCLHNRETPFPLLWQHRPSERIGSIESIAEDHVGLRVIGRIERPESAAAAALRNRRVTGLSFGYRARRYDRTGSGRELHDIDLYEVSLVTHPLQNRARVHLLA